MKVHPTNLGIFYDASNMLAQEVVKVHIAKVTVSRAERKKGCDVAHPRFVRTA